MTPATTAWAYVITISPLGYCDTLLTSLHVSTLLPDSVLCDPVLARVILFYKGA